MWNFNSIKNWLEDATEYLKFCSDFILDFPTEASSEQIEKLEVVMTVGHCVFIEFTGFLLCSVSVSFGMKKYCINHLSWIPCVTVQEAL